jgi:hypothetical protein
MVIANADTDRMQCRGDPSHISGCARCKTKIDEPGRNLSWQSAPRGIDLGASRRRARRPGRCAAIAPVTQAVANTKRAEHLPVGFARSMRRAQWRELAQRPPATRAG